MRFDNDLLTHAQLCDHEERLRMTSREKAALVIVIVLGVMIGAAFFGNQF